MVFDLAKHQGSLCAEYHWDWLGRVTALVLDDCIHDCLWYVCQDEFGRNSLRFVQLLCIGTMELFFECVAGFRQQSSFASGHAQQGVFPAASSPAVSHFGQVGRSRNCVDGVGRHDGMVPAAADMGDPNASLVDLDHDDDCGRTRNDFDLVGDPISRRQARDELSGTVVDVFRTRGLPRDFGSRMAATLLCVESHGRRNRRLSFRPFGNP